MTMYDEEFGEIEMNMPWTYQSESYSPREGSSGGADYRGGGGGTSVGGRRPAYQIIEQRGIFNFSQAQLIADGHFDQYRNATENVGLVEFTRDIVYLSAAEYALLTTVVNAGGAHLLPMQAPVTVGPDAFAATIIKADCGGLDYHSPKNHEDSVRLWDIALFGGDMSKIELIYGDRLRLDQVENMIVDLEERFSDSETTIGRTIGASGMLRVQGVLWKAKLALNVAPSDVESHIDGYLDRIPLLPSSGVGA